jgi:hypothetical protein
LHLDLESVVVPKFCGALLWCLSVACLSAWGLFAEDLPDVESGYRSAFLKALPRTACDEESVSHLVIEELGNLEDASQRVRLLKEFDDYLPRDAQPDERLRAVVASTVEQCDDSDVPRLASIVARFPSLHKQLLDRAATPRLRNLLRSQLARHVVDFEVAQRLLAEIDAPETRRRALIDRIYRSQDFDEQLALAKESISLITKEDDVSNYRELLSLSRHAADHAETLCAFLERHVPADESIGIYRSFAYRARGKNPAAEKMYVDAAWSRVPETAEPHEHASSLLSGDYGPADRDAWLAKYDEFIMPALRDARTHIGPLSDLARFDVELMIDRTRKSCVHPARRFERVMPSVMARALWTYPDVVLTWLEENEAPWKDACVLQIARSVTPWNDRSKPPPQQFVERICRLVLAIENRQQRLQAIAQLAADLRYLGLTRPADLIREGRALLGQREDFARLDLQESDNWPLFWLGFPGEQLRRFKAEIERFRALPDYEVSAPARNLCFHIRQSNVSSAERMALYRQLEGIAEKIGNRHLQSEIASCAALHDPAWAIDRIWRVLPEDRGRSGKKKYFDYRPPPYDAVDAVYWLRSKSREPEENAPLVIALWKFLPNAPPQDRDGVRLSLCYILVDQRHLGTAMGIAETIDDPVLRIQAHIRVFYGLNRVT